MHRSTATASGAVEGVSSPVLDRIAHFVVLTWTLAVRELHTRYERSSLGLAWAVLQPLSMLLVFSIIRGFVGIPSDGVPYTLFCFSALMLWLFFANSVLLCGSCIQSNASVIQKISLPRVVFPLSVVVVCGVDLLIACGILGVLLAVFQTPLSWNALWAPLYVGLTAALALGLGLLMSVYGAFRRDFVFAAQFGLQLLLYMSPVIYPMSRVPVRWQWLYSLNPMAGLVENFRTVVVKGTPPDLWLTVVPLLAAALVWAVAWPTFKTMSDYFADVI